MRNQPVLTAESPVWTSRGHNVPYWDQPVRCSLSPAPALLGRHNELRDLSEPLYESGLLSRTSGQKYPWLLDPAKGHACNIIV